MISKFSNFQGRGMVESVNDDSTKPKHINSIFLPSEKALDLLSADEIEAKISKIQPRDSKGRPLKQFKGEWERSEMLAVRYLRDYLAWKFGKTNESLLNEASSKFNKSDYEKKEAAYLNTMAHSISIDAPAILPQGRYKIQTNGVNLKDLDPKTMSTIEDRMDHLTLFINREVEAAASSIDDEVRRSISAIESIIKDGGKG